MLINLKPQGEQKMRGYGFTGTEKVIVSVIFLILSIVVYTVIKYPEKMNEPIITIGTDRNTNGFVCREAKVEHLDPNADARVEYLGDVVVTCRGNE